MATDRRGLLDTSTVILLPRIDDAVHLPDEPLAISAAVMTSSYWPRGF